MTTNVFTDEQLDVLARRLHDLFRRIRDGTPLVEHILQGLEDLIDDNFAGLRRIIDCDAQPFIPDGLSFHLDDQIKSTVRGEITFDPAKVRFHLDKGQRDGNTISGDDLCAALEGQPVLPVNVLDHLLVNPKLIPDAWKTDERGYNQYTYFWTVYRDSNGSRCVRYLCWCGDRWGWRYHLLGHPCDDRNPAAISAS